MNISNLTVWIDENTVMEPATVPMAFRIGACTFFLTEDPTGLQKLNELIAVLQEMSGAETYRQDCIVGEQS